MVATVAVILSLAVLGLVAINTSRVDATRLQNTTVTATDAAGAAADVPAVDPAYSLTEASPMSAIVKMMAALALVIALVYAVLWFMRRMMGRRYGRRNGNNALEVLESAYVGPHKTVSLVRVGKRSVLVGVTDTQVSVLTELDADETEQLLVRDEAAAPQPSFSGALASAVDRIKDFGLKRKITALES